LQACRKNWGANHANGRGSNKPCSDGLWPSVRRLSRLTLAIRVTRLHIVIYVAGEVELLDSVIHVKDAKQRVLVVWIRCPANVKASGIEKLSRDVEFQGLAGLPRAPHFTILFGRADLQPECGR
jgi:hypothetical protein